MSFHRLSGISYFLGFLLLLLITIHGGNGKSAHEKPARKTTSSFGKNLDAYSEDKGWSAELAFSFDHTNICDSWICDLGQECRPGTAEDPLPTCVCRKSCPPPKHSKKKGNDRENEISISYEEDDDDIDEDEADLDIGQVCGSDGVLYPSECELHRTACLTGNPHLHIVGVGVAHCSRNKEDEENDDDGGRDVFPGSQENGENSSSSSDTNEDDSLKSIKEVRTGRRGSSLCSKEEYEIFKEALLLYNREHVVKPKGKDKGGEADVELHLDADTDSDSANEISLEDEPVEKEEVLSLIFGHFDHNHDGQLSYGELQRIGVEESLGRPLLRCHPVDFLRFDDANVDGSISPKEFQTAFTNLYGTQVLQLKRKNWPLIHVTARVGQPLKLECPLLSSSSSSQPVVEWTRYGQTLVEKGIADGDGIQVSVVGEKAFLSMEKVDMKHGGNFSCKRQNEEQRYVVTVISKPTVEVRPRIVMQRTGEDVMLECRAKGEPQATTRWLKNESPLLFPNPRSEKYLAEGPFLTVRNVDVADTGAYMCEGRNAGGKTLEFASLLVVDQDLHVPLAVKEQEGRKNESLFVLLHGGGITMYDPTNCRLAYQISGTDIIPGTQNDLMCGNSPSKYTRCYWGEAVVVASIYIYLPQPKLSRVLVVSLSEMVVVDVIPTMSHPFRLHFVPHLDQVWVQSQHSGVLQVVHNATIKKKHVAEYLTKDKKFGVDRALSVFLPEGKQFNHGYVTKEGVRGLYKLDLRSLKYVKSVDLTKYSCLPDRVHYISLYGFVLLECREPVLGRSSGEIILDYLTDEVLFQSSQAQRRVFVSPDSKVLVTFISTKRNKRKSVSGTNVVVQNITQSGLVPRFQIETHINASDATFFPSQQSQGSYDFYITATGESSLLLIDLSTGETSLVPGVGRPPNRMMRHISVEPTDFGRYLISPGRENIYVINGESQTVNCRVGRGLTHTLSWPILWLQHGRSKNVTESGEFS